MNVEYNIVTFVIWAVSFASIAIFFSWSLSYNSVQRWSLLMTTVPTAALLGIMIANASESSRIDKETEAVFSEKLGVDDFSIIGFSSQLERGSSNYVEVRHRAAPYDVLVKTKREGNQLEFFFYNEKRELVPATPKAFAQYAEAVDSGEFELILPRKLSHLN